MDRIVECVPNFSEGRRVEVVERIVERIESVAGVAVLDRHLDPDHNRSVITFIAHPETVVEAAVRAAAAAAELIDLRRHTGQHPRIGAIDVLPFVPLREVSMEECVRLAHQAGERVARELGIPVYFYADAARRPDRVNLEDVRRRGGFEQLRAEIEAVAAHAPDVGPPRLHESAGAVAVGARHLLVAYNVNLRTTDLMIARRIARAVRGRDGGLRYLKALGLQLGARGLVQVSMNLVRYDQTQLHHAFEMVRREAERWGVAIAGSEIVGLLPQAALAHSAEYFLQIENFSPSLVLENRIADALAELGDKQNRRTHIEAPPQAPFVPPPSLLPPLWPYQRDAAAAQADLSGGAAAAHAAALGAALGEVIALTLQGRKQFEDRTAEVGGALQELTMLRARLADAAPADVASFRRVVAARHLPHATEDEQRDRAHALEAALEGATTTPIEAAGMAARVAELLVTLARVGDDDKWLPDMAAAAQLSLASVVAARYNVLANTAEMKDAARAAAYRARAGELLERVRAAAAHLEAKLITTLIKDEAKEPENRPPASD